MNDEFVDVGAKREAESPPPVSRAAKKPRDNRLRECFIITPLEGGGEQISCRHCPDYNKTLQKFNPTKARAHLTDQCPGVDAALRQVLLDTTQAARKSLNEGGEGRISEAATPGAGAAATTGAMSASGSSKGRKPKGRNRPSPAYISIHTDDTSLDVTAPVVDGELLLRLSFPTDQLKLNFNAQDNMEGAALCIDGFMNMRADASWTASMCSMTIEGTRAGPHCQWSMNPDQISGEFEGGITRAQKVGKILKTLVLI